MADGVSRGALGSVMDELVLADEARHVALSHVMARYGTEQSGR